MKALVLIAFLVRDCLSQGIPYQAYHRPYQPPRAFNGYGNPNVRFGYQNPIRIAPTLAPAHSQPERWTSTSTPQACEEENNRNGQIHRKDRKTGKCYPVGSQIPCGGKSRNMAFYEDPTDSRYGECDCFRNRSPPHPLVYHPQTDTCYFIYQQAYCNDNHWLRFNEAGQPECEENPCHKFQDWNYKSNTNELVLQYNTRGFVPDRKLSMCVALGATCTGRKGDHDAYLYPETVNAVEDAKKNKTRVFIFGQGQLEPQCQVPEEVILPTDFRGIQQIRCRPGSRPRATGKCEYVPRS